MKHFFIAGAIALACSGMARAEGDEKIDSVLVGKDFNEVVVKASRINAKLKDLPNKVEVIRANQLKTATARDVGQLLTLNTGIDIIQYPGKLSAVGIRGFAPGTTNKYNALLINGLPAGTQNISTIDLSMIEQVEVMKGPFSALYGSGAMGGVINFTTPRSTGDICGKAILKVGSYDFYAGNANIGGALTDQFSFDLNVYGERQGNDYVIGEKNLLKLDETEKAIIDKSSRGATFPNTQYKQHGANGRIGYDINKSWRIDLNVGTYQANDIMAHGSYWGVYGADKKDLSRLNLNTIIEGQAGNHLMRFSPYWNKDLSEYYNDLSDENYISSNSTFKNYGFQLQDKIIIGAHNVIVGADYNTQRYESKRWKSADRETAPYKPDYQNNAFGVLAQAHLKFLDGRLNISVGGRFDQMKFKLEASKLLGSDAASEEHTIFNPNVGIKYEIINGLTAHSSFGTAFFAPDAFQKAGTYKGWYTYEGNPDLKPEESATFDIGLGYNNYTKGVNLDVTYFNTNHDNMIIRDKKIEDTSIRTYYNANEANMKGLEVMASYDFGALYDYAFSLKAYANLTFMLNTEVTMPEKVQTDGIKIPATTEDMKYVREQTGNFGIQFLYEKVSFRFNGRYMGSRIEDNWYTYYSDVRPDLPALAEEAQPEYWNKGLLKHPDHLVFDTSAYYEANQNLTFGVSVGNLFNEHYAEKDGYPMPGRNFMAKCVVSF